jgi:hypothetical protein
MAQQGFLVNEVAHVDPPDARTSTGVGLCPAGLHRPRPFATKGDDLRAWGQGYILTQAGRNDMRWGTCHCAVLPPTRARVPVRAIRGVHTGEEESRDGIVWVTRRARAASLQPNWDDDRPVSTRAVTLAQATSDLCHPEHPGGDRPALAPTEACPGRSCPTGGERDPGCPPLHTRALASTR